ncbi:MAG: hypothetical protein IT193_02130 [Propionibacteriaceae bacterium]|nr:hypothetical protein [Propionibacteriaceae bacterium]
MARRTVLKGLAVLCAAVLIPLGNPADAHAAVDCGLRPDRDLNGDGFQDAAVGDPYATVDGLAEAGTVTILYGDADGRIGEGERQTLTQADFAGTPEAGDHFGWSVTIARTNYGGCPGILVGAPGEDVSGATDAGTAHVITREPIGDDPDATVATSIVQSDVGGTVEAGDEFGYSIAAFGGTDEEPVTVAYGVPGENNDSGVVNLSHFTVAPLLEVQVRQGSRGLPGKPQAGDRFGHVVAIANLDIGKPDPADDDLARTLLVGAPGDVVAGHDNAGSVTAIRENLEAAALYTQNSPGIPGGAETGDRFGTAISVNIRPTTQVPALLAVGAPGEDAGSIRDAGSVTVLRNSNHTLVNRIGLTQATRGIAGSAEKGDKFGQAVAFRDDRALVIGVPGEDIGAVVDAGSAHIVRIGTSNISTPYPTLTEDSPGTAGQVEAGSRFGSSVAGLHSRGDGLEIAFAISSPFQDGGSVYVVSDSYPARSWEPTEGVRFGNAVG